MAVACSPKDYIASSIAEDGKCALHKCYEILFH